MKTREFNDILQKYIEGSCTDEERLVVEKWCDFIMRKESKTIEYPFESKAVIYEKIIRARGNRPYAAGKASDKEASKIRFFGFTDAVAAALVIAALCFTQFNGIFSTNTNSTSTACEYGTSSNSVVVNNSSSPVKVHFEDGTEVVLDPKSRLCNIDFTKSSRKVRLEGRAFFNVARNPQRPFYIFTNNITTKVLGTSFTIDAQPNGEETVVVKTGKVAVYKRAEGEAKAKEAFVTITPNLQVHYSKAAQSLIPSIVAYPVIIPKPEQNIASHKALAQKPTSPKMQFVGARAVDVFKALETAYGIKIKCDEAKLGKCVMTITLIDEDLYTRLRAVCVAIGASYKIDGMEIVVENGGC